MQEIITEILKRLGFPTKNVEELVRHLLKWDQDKLLDLSIITSNKEIIGYFIKPMTYMFISAQGVPRTKWRYCSLGSELVARLKGNYNDSH
jgi:hypothetical protein